MRVSSPPSSPPASGARWPHPPLTMARSQVRGDALRLRRLVMRDVGSRAVTALRPHLQVEPAAGLER
eukprot:2150705-Prymnesium_polylepis.1